MSYAYYICLDINKFDQKSRKSLRKIEIVNLYSNKIGQEQLLEELCIAIQRVIENIKSK